MHARTIRAWTWTHKWSSLISTLFLLMLCVTGLPLVFSHELNEALLHEPWAPKNPDGRLLTLDEVLAAGLAKHPGEVPAFMMAGSRGGGTGPARRRRHRGPA